MNTLPTHDPMRVKRLDPNQDERHLNDERPPEELEQPTSHDWRERLHDDLRGHTFEEQEQMLSPDLTKKGKVDPEAVKLDVLKDAKPAGPPKKTPPPPKRKAPPPPKPKAKELPKAKDEPKAKEPPKREGPKRKAPPPPKVPAENLVVSARLKQGGEAAGMIKLGIEHAKLAHEAQVEAQQKQPPGKHKLPPPPKLDHAAAANALGYAQSLLKHDAETAGKATVAVPNTLLTASGDAVDHIADRIAKKVEPPHVESTRDLAVGLREGDEAMLRRVLTRGGAISQETLKQVRALAQNQDANVYEMSYLGMAPVAYKRSKLESQEKESDDPTVREHETMRSLQGDPNVLKAGGKTLEHRGFIMELAKKGDLAGVRKKLIDLPLAERMEVWKHLMRGGFKALEKLHSSGRTHGDVKNENFLLGDDLEPRLMDFGTTGKEKDAKASGTAQYMAPEIHKTQAKKPTDVWSMGESLLLGVFGMNSVDFARDNKGESKSRFMEEQVKQGLLADGKWLTHVRDQVKDLPDAEVFMDFIKSVMALKPEKRLTAKQALRHQFLRLAHDGRNRGKEKLREVM